MDLGCRVLARAAAVALALALVAIRFNLPAIPAGCQVTGARLRLYASSYKTGRTPQAWRVASAWTRAG
jgi:hypothetical protein